MCSFYKRLFTFRINLPNSFISLHNQSFAIPQCRNPTIVHIHMPRPSFFFRHSIPHFAPVFRFRQFSPNHFPHFHFFFRFSLYALIIPCQTHTMLRLLFLFVFLSIASHADEMSTGVQATCLEHTDSFTLNPVFIENFEQADLPTLKQNGTHIFPANPGTGTLPITCKLSSSNIVKATISYKDIGDAESFKYLPQGECSLPDNATVSITLNNHPIATHLPLLNGCTWGHIQTIQMTTYGLSLCVVQPGGGLSSDTMVGHPKTTCKHFPLESLTTRALDESSLRTALGIDDPK